MKLKADRATLLRALAHIQSVAEKRNTIPILANVMLEAREGKLRLTATDMEIAVDEEIEASVDREGRTTAPAATLYEIVRRLPDGSVVELDHPGGDAARGLGAGRYATGLNVLPVEDFPNMTAGKLPCQFALAPDVLRDLIDRTRFAISTEETRYYLNGIFLHHGGGKLRAAATDGHRLARVETELPDGAAEIPGVIIPRKTVAEIRKLLDEGSAPVSISLSDTRILFQVGAVRLTSKLIDGTFPDYERVIPQGNDKILHVGRREFSDAVARVAAISQERSRPVKLSLSPNLLVLSAASPDQGTASEALDEGRATYDSEPLEIGFQARYLNDITDHIKDTVEFRFADGSAPTVVQDTADASALYVLMPMRV
jgi:DNA polymerase III subunit beta